MRNLSKAAKLVRVMNAQAAGVTTVNGALVDTEGYGSVLFIAAFGALTAGQVTSLKAQAGSKSDGSDMADLAGTSTGPLADANGNGCLQLEVITPQSRYVRPVVVRGTANAAIDGVFALLFTADKEPVALDPTVIATKCLLAPAFGAP
ncbi:MAG TPA: hypothetical protein VFW87_14300 [Pirellulales bacterium]|nr:hypothetical protein [Pirellulales bacterium]